MSIASKCARVHYHGSEWFASRSFASICSSTADCLLPRIVFQTLTVWPVNMPSRRSHDRSQDRISLHPYENHRALSDGISQSLSCSHGKQRRGRRARSQRCSSYSAKRQTGREELNDREIWTRNVKIGTIRKIVYTRKPCCGDVVYVAMPETFRPRHT